MAPRARLSMPPGAIIGYRKNGCPIRIIAGGAPDGDEGGQGGTGQDGGTGNGGAGTGQQEGQNGGQGGTGGQPDGGTGSGSGTGGDADPEKTARVIAAIRGDVKTEREKRQTAERELAEVKAAQTALQAALDADKGERDKQMDALAKALGLKPEDEAPSPEKVAAQLAEVQRVADAEKERATAAEARATDLLRQAEVERAVLRAAPGLDANGLALLDSRSFVAKVSGLDPAADGFADSLAAEIKAAAEGNPAYQVTKRQQPQQRSSGGEFNAQPGGERQWTDEDVDKASPKQIEEAIKKGLLRDLGVGSNPKRSRRAGQ